MARNVDLLEGSIVGGLTSLALPIMATSLIQMAYNMTDMIWIGRLSADAVAAVGAAGLEAQAVRAMARSIERRRRHRFIRRSPFCGGRYRINPL